MRPILQLCIIFGYCMMMPQVSLPQHSLGGFIGWYQPSLKKANAALKYSMHKFSGIGDDEFGGNVSFGSYFEQRLGSHWTVRGECFYWQKTARQTVTSLNNDQYPSDCGEGRAVIRIMPITINALYGLNNPQNTYAFYWGMGLGLAFSNLNVKAQIQEPDTLLTGTFLTHEIFSAEDSNWGILLQAIFGMKYRVSPTISFFVEGRVISGQFRLEEPRYKVDEQVLLSGFKFVVGVMYSWSRSSVKPTKKSL